MGIVSTLSNGSKLVLVIALESDLVSTSHEDLLIAAINDVNVLPILVMRVIETAADNSTINDDIKENFDDVIKRAHSFISYDIGEIVQYLVDCDLTAV